MTLIRNVTFVANVSKKYVVSSTLWISTIQTCHL